MAAPSVTARSTPVGIKLDDGFPTKIAFAADPDVSLWEKTVTPPGADGGDPVNTTTMWNTVWRTFASRQLKTLTNSQFTAAFDPAVISQIEALVNVETDVTVHFPDGSTWTFYGYLQTFTPDAQEEGSQPTATCVVVPTNNDPDDGTEAGPELVSVASV